MPSRLTVALADRYRIERELGQGGMATVYLAHDLRHDRPVALKVLRPELAAVIGAERFLAEIKTTANLQHPHILALFDSGEVDGTVFYVMPYVAGESLRDRLAREKQLPVEDAVRIAREVADALDYAHRHGVIHRDIKPENVLLHDGRAQVADFGIALAVSRSDGGSRMTETGMSLGTPHYMSPEQAMGEREITGRSDVYALGCVTYEMLAGEPPFMGPTAQAIIARVMTEAPRSLQMQRHTIPTHVEAAVQRALEKLPADRFQSAAEFGTALADPTYASRITVTRAAIPGEARGASRWRALNRAALATLAAAALWGWLRPRPGLPVTWNYVGLGDSLTPPILGPGLAISPDGNTLVISDDRNDGPLWLKRREALEPVPMPGTERATNPVFSPDGEWVAFVVEGRLKKTRIGVGGAVNLVDSAAGFFGGPAWLDDGSIAYVTPSQYELRLVNSAGGVGTTITTGEDLPGLGIGQPTPLPGKRGLFFIVCSSGCTTSSIYVLDLQSGVKRQLVQDAARAWYLPTGHILYVRRDGVALAAPFDLRRLEITGEAVPVLEDVASFNGSFAQLAVSPGGRLAYVRADGAGQGQLSVVRVAMDGTARLVDTAWFGAFNSMALSPDGRRLAVGAGQVAGSLAIWIKQLDRGPFSRLSIGGSDRRPAWSPDGRTVAYIRDSIGSSAVYARPVDGSASDRLLVRLDRMVQEVIFSPDGKWVVMRTDDTSPGAGDIVGVRTSGDTVAVPLAATEFSELHPAISPDGRWLAYTSLESGTREVYVRPFQASTGARWQVSNQGGDSPRWAPDGRTLYFITQPGYMLTAARLGRGTEFEVVELQPLFSVYSYVGDSYHQSYEVLPDGEGFMMIRPRDTGRGAAAPRLVVVESWFSDLRARLGN